MASIVYRDQAEDDLVEIWRYIAERNRDAADRLVTDIREATDRLIDNPLSATDWNHVQPGLRKLAVGNYGLLHRVIGDEVVILRVIHLRRDFGALDL